MAAIELGCPYFIYAPDGVNYFSLNLSSEAQYVGVVDDVTGLDSPGVRENAQPVNAGDGGYHGRFWFDRRPFTVSGVVMPQFPLVSRDSSQEKIEGIVMKCLAADGALTWTPADGVTRRLPFRAQQPPRITTGQAKAVKNFAMAMVTADYRVTSYNLQSAGPVAGVNPSVSAQNIGNAPAAPLFSILGPVTNPVITNLTTGKFIKMLGTVPAVGSFPTGYCTIDLTGPYPSVNNSGSNFYYQMDPLNTDWSIAVADYLSGAASGNNTFQLTGSGMSGATSLQVFWRHSWV